MLHVRTGFFRRLAICALVLGSAVGCTRSFTQDAVLRFQPNSLVANSKLGALSVTGDLAHIVVNVRGPGMPNTVLFTWDAEHGGVCCDPAPSEILLSVPSGSARLIQFMGVFQDPVSGAMSFTYGDRTVDLKPGIQVVDITASLVGSASGSEATISGQYVTKVLGGAGFGPTGLVDMMLAPPNGAPPMLIETNEMFNGWFSHFGLEGVPFKYYLRATGAELSGVDYNSLAAAITLSNPSHLLQVRLPNTPFYVDHGGGSREQRDDRGDFFMGFFGPAALSLSAPQIYYPSGGPITGIWDADTGGSSFSWQTSYDPASFSRIGGGSPSPGGTDYVNQLSLYPERFSNGRWGVSGIRGPYRMNSNSVSPCGSSGYSAIHSCYDSLTANDMADDQLKLAWEYLPGVFSVAGGITGTTVYFFDVTSCSTGGGSIDGCKDLVSTGNGDGIRCPEMGLMAEAIKVADRVDSSSTQYVQYNLASYPQLQRGHRYSAIICPYREIAGYRQYFTSGAMDYQGFTVPDLIPDFWVTGGLDTMPDHVLDGPAADITITWDPIPDAMNYEVQIYSSGGSSLCGQSSSVPDVSFTIPSPCTIGTNGNYSIFIRATDSYSRPVAVGYWAAGVNGLVVQGF